MDEMICIPATYDLILKLFFKTVLDNTIYKSDTLLSTIKHGIKKKFLKLINFFF